MPFFINADPNFVSDVISHLKFEMFMPGDTIIKANTKGDRMFFIQEGKSQVSINKFHFIYAGKEIKWHQNNLFEVKHGLFIWDIVFYYLITWDEYIGLPADDCCYCW